MTQNLIDLAKLAKDEAVYGYNWGVGKVGGLIGLTLTYLFALWGCMWVGYGTLNMVMWAFVLIFSLMYWKGVGGIAALLEFFYQKDDKKKQSVWRLYLILFMSAIFAGYTAIVLRMIGAPTAFPMAILVLLLCVATSLYLPDSTQLNKYLPWMTTTVVILALGGLIPQMNPHLLKKWGVTVGDMPVSEITANNLGDRDVAIQDKRRTQQLRWIGLLMECKLTENVQRTWKPEQTATYKSLCEANGNITFEEIGTHWPNAKKVWEDSYAGKKPIKAGGVKGGTVGGKVEATEVRALPEWVPSWAREWGPMQWMGSSLLGLVVLHLVLAAPFIALLSLFGVKISKKDDTAEKKTTTKATESSDWSGAKKLLVVAALGVGGYMAWNSQTVVEMTGRDGSDVYTPTVILPSMTELNRANFTAEFKHLNAHIDLPQRLWHGKSIDITHDASITLKDGVDVMLAFGEGNRGLDMYLTEAKCAPVSNRVPYVCEGMWRTKQGSSPLQGYFRGAWNTQGTIFLVKLYKEDHKVENAYAIAEVMFINRPKDVR